MDGPSASDVGFCWLLNILVDESYRFARLEFIVPSMWRNVRINIPK